MFRFLLVMCAAVCCLAAEKSNTPLSAAPRPDPEGFIPLFNGRDLTNWLPAINWAVEDGVITLKNRTDGREHNDNYLWVRQPYGDFVLDLEFKVTKGTNSGVYIRTSDLGDPVQTGLEVQVAASAPDRPLGRGSVGGIYDLVAPRAYALKTEAWNRYTITCDGPRISVLLNGQAVSEANLDLWTEARKNPDGTPNKFTRALRDFARTGYLGFQDHGTPVWYRNVRIKPINTGR